NSPLSATNSGMLSSPSVFQTHEASDAASRLACAVIIVAAPCPATRHGPLPCESPGDSVHVDLVRHNRKRRRLHDRMLGELLGVVGTSVPRQDEAVPTNCIAPIETGTCLRES